MSQRRSCRVKCGGGPGRLVCRSKSTSSGFFFSISNFAGSSSLCLTICASTVLRRRSRALGVHHRVVVLRALEHADQRGAFQHVQRGGGLSK